MKFSVIVLSVSKKSNGCLPKVKKNGRKHEWQQLRNGKWVCLMAINHKKPVGSTMRKWEKLLAISHKHYATWKKLCFRPKFWTKFLHISFPRRESTPSSRFSRWHVRLWGLRGIFRAQKRPSTFFHTFAAMTQKAYLSFFHGYRIYFGMQFIIQYRYHS